MRLTTLSLVALILSGPTSLFAQDNTQTLADIRQELNVLFVEVQRLKREMSTTAAPSVNTAGSSVLDRVAAMEAELQRLTAQTEQLQNRVNRVVTDGTNRIGDLEFRLCELEPECDISQLDVTTTLGGGGLPQAPAAPAGPDDPATPVTEMAVGEEADYQAAAKALAEGDYQSAADQFAAFNASYPGSPLAAEAELNRGKALDGMGDTREAARAYLAAFSGDAAGPVAPDALFELGAALGRLGQVEQACITLGEVGIRFPAAQAAIDAQAEMGKLSCS